MALTGRKRAFALEYLVDFNATQAAIRANYSPKGARQTGHKLLTDTDIAEFLAPHLQRATEVATREEAETGMAAQDVLTGIFRIARADARDLVALHRVCCRYCYGAGNRMQFTAGEMERRREEFDELIAKIPMTQWAKLHSEKRFPVFDEKGGVGYNIKNPPNADCPECFGEGVERIVAKDTRDLGPDAVALYAGAKMTQAGLEIKMHDKLAALDKAARIFQLFGDEAPGANGNTQETVQNVFVAVYPERKD